MKAYCRYILVLVLAAMLINVVSSKPVPIVPDKLLTLIRTFEGLRLEPYLCSGGRPTIGYGHTAVSLSANTITVAEAERLLKQDAIKVYSAAGKMSPILLDHEDKRIAIASFIFNLGPENYRTSVLKRRIDKGCWNLAHSELQRWVYSGDRKLQGLVERRAVEGELLLSTSTGDKAVEEDINCQ